MSSSNESTQIEVHEIDDLERLTALLDGVADTQHPDKQSCRRVVFQALDLRRFDTRIAEFDLSLSVFLGCRLGPAALERAAEDGALLFPRLEHCPFEPYRNRLYTPDELMAGYRVGEYESYRESLDGRVYEHFLATGGAEPPSILETLARRLHDHAVTDALRELLIDKKVVAVMGGHAMSRAEPRYRQIAYLARRLTREGFLMATGGGPGAMEATHLGACHADRSEAELDEAVASLAIAPSYKDGQPWLETSLEVLQRLRDSVRTGGSTIGSSLGIPTWVYGHEPPTVFASDIAKYFANSVREDGLLAIARSGVVFAPGSAGTVQEVFQDAAQNHYETAGTASPMLFLGGDAFWEEELPALPLLRRLANGRQYENLICAADSNDEIVERILDFDGRES